MRRAEDHPRLLEADQAAQYLYKDNFYQTTVNDSETGTKL